ncbi:MAG TPA: hypothetical protein VFI70_05000 [Nitrososphaeraceae archaeon]|nr:hypothetical protein [Nitrososphaeraceae archaeon]
MNCCFILERQIKWLENYSRGNNGKSSSDVVKQLKQELAALLEEDAKADKLRNLPLYSYRITGWKFVYSQCYDKVYNNMLVKTLLIINYIS